MVERETWTAKNFPELPPRSSAEALAGVPAEILLNRLDIATIVVGVDGVVVYANPACERLLGYQASGTLEGRSLATLLTGRSENLPKDWLDVLCDPHAVTNWNHSDGYPVGILASGQRPLPDHGCVLMVSLQDVSGKVWPEVPGRFG